MATPRDKETPEETRIELPWPPTVNTYYRTVVINGSGRTMLSKKARQYRTSVSQRLILLTLLVYESRRLSVKITLHAPTKRKYDIDNRVKAILDALEHAEVYHDDEQIDRLEVIRGEVLPRDGKVFVEIEAIE